MSNIYDKTVFNGGMSEINPREVYIDEVLYFPMFISEEIQEFVYKKRKMRKMVQFFKFFFALLKFSTYRLN